MRSKLTLAIGALALIAGSVSAQTYPVKPIRLVVPYATGGGPDILARLFAQELTTSLGPMIVDNRSGMGGSLGADVVAKAPGDGYTLLVTTTATQAINPALYANIPYDWERDFTPIAQIANTSLMLVVANDIPAKNVQELVAYARGNPGKLTFASAGAGTMQHITAELFRGEAGIDLVHVPYKGTGQIMPDLAGGRVSMLFNSVASVLPFAKEGRVRAIAVTSPQRSPAAPDVPTVAESGFPGFEASAWYAVYGPAGLPAPIVQRLNAEFVKAVGNPKVRERYAALGLDPAASTPAELAALTRRDFQKWSRVIREKKITAE